MCKKSFTFKLIKGESNCVLSLGFAELSNNTHILQLLGEIIKIEPNEKMQTFVYREETSKNNFGGYILFVQSLTLFNRFCLYMGYNRG